MDTLTIEEFKSALPISLKKSVNPALLTQINEKLADPDMYDTYRENLLGYVHVMKEGKFKLSNYIDAVKYVSFKLMGKTNLAAFTVTFPDKIAKWQQSQLEAKDIASYVSAYNKSKLVGLLYEQTLTPFWVINQDVYQKAINTQAELMVSAKSEKVRADAANSLLTHLKPPETQKIDLNLGLKSDSMIDALREQTQKLVDAQRDMLTTGVMNAQEVASTVLLVDKTEEDIEDAVVIPPTEISPSMAAGVPLGAPDTDTEESTETLFNPVPPAQKDLDQLKSIFG